MERSDMMGTIFLAKFAGCFRHMRLKAEAFIQSPPCSLFSMRYALRRGQSTVEYMLMLATTAAVALAMGIMFHKMILGGIFTMVGLIIGAGQPK